MCNVKETKQNLRKEWKARRGAILNREEKDKKIQELFLSHPRVKQAKSVFLFLSIGSEVDTFPILEELLKRGVRVSVPRCHPKTSHMDAVAITHLDMVTRGNYGILEPSSDLPALDPEEIEVAVVPALAFDKEGYRLGYGGGYYDRFLANFQGLSIGLAYRECMTDHLPRGAFDQTVDFVITEVSL